jgi:hypothetical protein
MCVFKKKFLDKFYMSNVAWLDWLRTKEGKEEQQS